MMLFRVLRPYVAVVADSFNAALSSRVLWAAMLAIWLLLASLAPIGLREDYTTSFRWFDVYNGTRMKALLAQGTVDPAAKKTPLGHLASAMPDELQRKLRRVGEGDEVRIQLSLLTDALNELIDAETPEGADNPDWYDEAAWSQTVPLRELRELNEKPSSELSESLLRRRSRLRIEAALPGVFEARSSRSVLLTYGLLDFPTGSEIDRSQFEVVFNQFVIPTMVHWLLGFVLVFLGVLVTASIVPDMLQTGSLHLLLSKPVSRTGLLISKFVGGCAFVFLCVAQLVIGLWLISGWRLGIWNPRILWCIPVSVFLFSVFYSVSVLAGLKWRSPIISIAAAGALAAICVVVGVVGGVIDARIVETDRVRSMVMAGDDLIAITGGGGMVRFDEQANQWQPLIESEAMTRDRILVPVALDEDHVLTARVRNGRFNPFGSGSLDLLVLARENGWQPQPSLRLPTATERLLRVANDGLLAVNTADLLVTSESELRETIGAKPLPAESEATQQVASDESDDLANIAQAPSPQNSSPRKSARNSGKQNSDPSRGKTPTIQKTIGSWLSTLVTMQGGATEEFVSILPRTVALSPPTRLSTINSVSGRPRGGLIVLSGDRLQRLTPPAKKEEQSAAGVTWTLQAQVDLERVVDRSPPTLASSNQYVMVSRGENKLMLFDAKSLRELGQLGLDDSVVPIELLAVSESLFVMRSTSGLCYPLAVSQHAESVNEAPNDAGEDESAPQRHIDLRSPLAVDEVESLLWDAQSKMLVIAHHVDQVARFSLGEEATQALVSAKSASSAPKQLFEPSEFSKPRLSTWRMVDRYAMGTLELLTPQVLQLGETTAAMVSGNEALVLNRGGSGETDVVRYRIREPLINCGLFIAVILALSCLYFGRTDF